MSDDNTPLSDEEREAQFARASEVQAKVAEDLMNLPHVVGVGIGIAQKDGVYTGEIAVVVMVDEKLPSAQLADEDLIPTEIDGIRIDVQQTGGFGAFTAGT